MDYNGMSPEDAYYVRTGEPIQALADRIRTVAALRTPLTEKTAFELETLDNVPGADLDPMGYTGENPDQRPRPHLAPQVSVQPASFLLTGMVEDVEDEDEDVALTEFEQAVQVIADEQGWTQQTVGELAFGFLVNAAPAQVRESFLAYARQVQHTENLTTDDEDI